MYTLLPSGMTASSSILLTLSQRDDSANLCASFSHMAPTFSPAHGVPHVLNVALMCDKCYAFCMRADRLLSKQRCEYTDHAVHPEQAEYACTILPNDCALSMLRGQGALQCSKTRTGVFRAP